MLKVALTPSAATAKSPNRTNTTPQSSRNITESSKCTKSGSLQERKNRAGRSAWHDRRVRNAEAAGSNPARSTTTFERNSTVVRCYFQCYSLQFVDYLFQSVFACL
jgi:hypothetical protein